ncbi:MAG: hypothetical protein Q4G59_06775 [Planctomycetia bacterium]|nr:hypothetical protein [Planctomycetia bacterium]
MSPVDLTLRYQWLFPIWLAPLLLSCESGDKQADVLEHSADWLDIQTHRSVTFLQSFVMAFTFLSCATLTLFLVVSLLLPFIKLTESLSQ